MDWQTLIGITGILLTLLFGAGKIAWTYRKLTDFAVNLNSSVQSRKNAAIQARYDHYSSNRMYYLVNAAANCFYYLVVIGMMLLMFVIWVFLTELIPPSAVPVANISDMTERDWAKFMTMLMGIWSGIQMIRTVPKIGEILLFEKLLKKQGDAKQKDGQGKQR